MLVIGHRSCAAQYLENTLAAERRCRDYVGMITIDVQRCGSGELIAFHNETLHRVTDAFDLVSELQETILLSTNNEAALAEGLTGGADALIGYSFFNGVTRNVKYVADRDCDYVHVPHTLCFTASIVNRALMTQDCRSTR